MSSSHIPKKSKPFLMQPQKFLFKERLQEKKRKKFDVIKGMKKSSIFHHFIGVEK
jgi:hypothetical protein